MDAQRRAEITGWDAREFSDGFAGLRRLVDRGFSGAVTDGAAWLFVFEGRVIGVVDGDLDGFADASGTVYEAPYQALPVLFAMQEQGGDPRAQYYTNDTPLSEADRKLSQGGFTGYVELSENVLSGDYYVTYAAGESMAAAYVGNSRRLETGDDAFALADDEVGIYTVYEVDLNVRELPEDGASSGAAERASATPTGSVTAADEETDGPDSKSGGSDSEVSEGDGSDGESSDDDGADIAERKAGEHEGDPGPTATAGRGDQPDDQSTERESDRFGEEQDRIGEEPERNSREPTDAVGTDPVAASEVGGVEPPGSAERAAGGSRSEPGGPSSPSGETGRDVRSTAPNGDREERPASDDVFSEEEQWREQKSIPALDPSEASDPQSSRSTGGRAASRERDSRDSRRPHDRNRSAGADGASSRDEESPDPRSTGKSGASRSAVSQRGTEPKTIGRAEERVRQLESALEAAEAERESLESERDQIATERDELAAEIDRLETDVSALREERDRLREQLSAAREQLPESDRTLSPSEARSGTNLFVRYDSKGGATLADAHDGTVDREALRENLRIEHHTSFETEGLAVDGRPYEEFLRDTIEYGFTRWLVEDLPFEVSGTGNQSVLRDLYDALPEVDRAEIGGSVSIALRENGEETREQRIFDLVLRDRMGNPLFVADLNDSRDPTPEGTLESLVENGRDIAESNDPFAAAFAVTESFFEPGALETASDAVGGGLFSRSKRASFVKLSRKRGYHLCLVEARDGGFHMTVPDL
ncbi:MAG: DUF7527 domain-containing protein [Halorubrum sp.]